MMTEVGGNGTHRLHSADSGNDASLVTQVVLAERQGRDRGWWDQMGALYWPDSTVHLSWYKGDGAGFVSGSEAMGKRGLVTLHHMFAPVVHVRGDKAYVEVTAAVWSPTEIDNVSADLVSYSRLNYRLERREGRWGILSLDAIYEYTTLTPSVPGQIIEVPVDELAKFRSSYALLAWNIARVGNSVSNDELGDDRPETVRAFYAKVWQWLNGSQDGPIHHAL